MRKKMISKMVKVVAAAVLAVNIVVGTGNPLIISHVVEAAENGAFDGTYTYMVNDMGEPEPALINDGATVAVAMFYGTMIQLSCNEGVVPVVTAGCDDVAVAGANATNDGVLIVGIAVGSGVITVQDAASGAITYIVVNVLESVGTGAAATTTTTATTDTSTQIATTAYSYADNHKIVSSDGLLELNLDNITWSTQHLEYRSAPKMYYASDGILTIELYGDMKVSIGVSSTTDGYIPYPFSGNNTKIVVGGPSNQAKGSTEIRYYSVAIPGDGLTHGPIQSESTQLPIRVISLGGYSSDCPKGATTTYKDNIPMTFPNP